MDFLTNERKKETPTKAHVRGLDHLYTIIGNEKKHSYSLEEGNKIEII